MTTYNGRRSRLIARLAIVSIAAGLLVSSLPLTAGAGDAPLRQLKTFPNTGPLYVDSTHRLLYEVETESTLGKVAIVIMNLDTLKKKKTVLFDVPQAQIAPAYRGAGLHMRGALAVVDPVHGRLYYPRRDSNAGLVMSVIDGRKGTAKTYPLVAPGPLPAATPTANITIEGLAYDGRTDSLYALYMVPVASSGLTYTQSGRVIVAELAAADGTQRWTKGLDGCNTLPTNTSTMAPIGRGVDSVYAVCSAGFSLAQAGFGVLGGDATLIFKIPIKGQIAGSPTVFLSPGNSVLAQFDAPSERLLLMRPTVMAVFDGKHETWVGLVPTEARPLLGTNSGIGRVYLCTGKGVDPITKQPTGGVALTDALAAAQPPTAEDHPEIGCTNETSSWPIVGDGKTARVFLPQENSKWAVVKDNVARYTAPPELDSDAGVVDIPESPATTDSTFSAQAAAYGTRVVLVGGPLGTMDNSISTVAQVIRQNSYQVGLTIGESSREVRFASVPLAKLGKDGLQASAIAADRDDRAEGDLQTVRNYQLSGGNPSGREFTPPASAPQVISCKKEECTLRNTTGAPKWPYESSSCIAFGGGTDKPESDPSVPGSKAKCDFAKLVLDATADAPKQSVAGLVTIGDSTAKVRVFRDEKKGVVAHAESVARNISIAGQVFIASATASVDSFAAGHKGKASADSYTREFRGVTILSADKKSEVFKCGSPEECDPARVVSTINTVLGPRIVARMPKPDALLLHGTKKGTQASLRQNEWQQLEEKVLYDKPPEDLTMAAFELQINGNLRASSGVIVQLAGVTASSLYQIFKKPEPGILPTISIPSLNIPTIITTLPPEPGSGDQKPTVVSRLVTDRFRTGTKFVIGFSGNPALVLAGWILLLAPGYVALRRMFMVRKTGARL